MSNKLRTKAKYEFEKDFLKLMNKSVFGKLWRTKENTEALNFSQVKKEEIIWSQSQIITPEKVFTKNLLAIKTEKTQIVMNKPVYLGLTILDLNKILIYDFWYNYIISKYGEKGKLCYMVTASFIVHIKTEDIYKDIAEDVETRFGTSNYEIDRPLPMRKNKKVIGLMKDELSGKIMEKFVGLRPKTYSYLKDNIDKSEKVKGKEICVIKNPLNFRIIEID